MKQRMQFVVLSALLILFTALPTRSMPEAYKTIVHKSKTAQRLESLGLVNVAEMDTTIRVQLLYATADNFLGEVLYDDLTEAYLHPEAAGALVKAQQELRRLKPGYSLIVYDAARPMAAQQRMWDFVKGTPRYIYVSNPARGGGLHNYGLAVDVSIVDAAGHVLPMGTKVDHLGAEAHTDREEELVASGAMTARERDNRLLLRQVMRAAGYKSLRSEWWHFNFKTRDEAKRNYRLIP